MCSRKCLTFIKDLINNESVCHFMVVQLFKLSTKDICVYIHALQVFLAALRSTFNEFDGFNEIYSRQVCLIH